MAWTIFLDLSSLFYFEWSFSQTQFTTCRSHKKLPNLITTHNSTLIRKLKNVEMWLQYNKVKNLQLAIEQMNGVIITSVLESAIACKRVSKRREGFLGRWQ